MGIGSAFRKLASSNVQRLGQVFFLKQAMGKAPDVRGFDHEVVRQLSSNAEINHVGVWRFQLVVQAPGQAQIAPMGRATGKDCGGGPYNGHGGVCYNLLRRTPGQYLCC